jgi:Glutaredoxin-like domain (DUF836)
MHLILYVKPGCHLCEGLQEKLAQITTIAIDLELRDITTQPDWWAAYEYEIPVLQWVVDPGPAQRIITLPRLSPRSTLQKLEQMLETHRAGDQRE